jgi:hypothetical protein
MEKDVAKLLHTSSVTYPQVAENLSTAVGCSASENHFRLSRPFLTGNVKVMRV